MKFVDAAAVCEFVVGGLLYNSAGPVRIVRPCCECSGVSYCNNGTLLMLLNERNLC